MGGEGSGRHADPVNKLIEQRTPIASANSDGFFLPNLGAAGRNPQVIADLDTRYGQGGAVDSVFTRVGDVVAATNDYTWAQIDKTTSNIANITTKSHTSLTDIGTNTHAGIDTHIAGTGTAVHGLGTASIVNTGTSGATIPLLNAANTYSALQTFSNGIAFANETMSTYDEGTWTPGFAFGGGTTGITYSSQVGAYTKVGRMVLAGFNVTLSSNGTSTGDITVTGLPFTVQNSSGAGGAFINQIVSLDLTAGYTFVTLLLIGAGTTAVVLENGDNNAAQNLNETDTVDTTRIQGGFIYSASTS